MLEGTVVTRKLKAIMGPIREKSITPLGYRGKPSTDVLVSKLVADLLETLRPHAGLYEMGAPETADVLRKVSASLSDIANKIKD